MSLGKCFICFVITVICVPELQCSNILFLSGVPSPSHHIWNKAIMTELGNRGHNMTILTVEIEYSKGNLHYIFMENIYEAIAEEWMTRNGQDGGNFEMGNIRSPLSIIKETYDFYNFVSSKLIATQGVKKLLNYPPGFKFDAIIFDFTLGQVLLGFVDRFNYPPLISISAFNTPPSTWSVSAMPIMPSYMPHFATNFPASRMLYLQRTKNFIYHAYDWIYRSWFFMRKENKLVTKLFGPHLPPLEELEAKTELVLVNSDWSMDYAHPVPPNVIPVGGLQIQRKDPLTTMDSSVKYFMDESNNGVVLFSLGSNMRSELLGKDKLNIFLEAFKSLREYDFIWKYDGSELKSVPDNIMIVDWLDQNAILAHPKMRLFITHGGLLSVQESTWHTIPMLGVPLFMDQHLNINKAVSRGDAEQIDINTVTIQELIEKIRRIIEDDRFKGNIRQTSQLFREQPQDPLDRAIFWIEQVIKHKHLKHLKSPAMGMTFVQIYMLDIAGIMAVIILIYWLIIRRHINPKIVKNNEIITTVDKKNE